MSERTQGREAGVKGAVAQPIIDNETDKSITPNDVFFMVSYVVFPVTSDMNRLSAFTHVDRVA